MEPETKDLFSLSTEDPEFEQLDREDIVDWLLDKEIPLEYCRIFKDNYIDGKEFLVLKEEDVYKMVPPVGLAKKVLRLLPSKDVPTSKATPPTQESVLGTVSMSPPTRPETPTTSRSDNGSISGTSGMSSGASNELAIPSHWSATTQKAIDERKLDAKVRCDIVRTLATLLITKYGPQPRKCDVQQFARQLILKYPYMRDDIGTGYASWYEKIIERLRNVRKRSKGASDCVVENKKAKRSSQQLLMRRYPPRVHEQVDDTETINQQVSSMNSEMMKQKPREIVILPLMKDTYSSRRDMITSESCSGVDEILQKYPALRLPAAIEQDMNTIFENECANVKTEFMERWKRYVTAILTYSDHLGKETVVDASSDYSRESAALSVLIELLKCSKELVLHEIESGETIEEFCTKFPSRVAPRVVVMPGRAPKYHIVVEHIPICQVDSFTQCLFLLLSCFYVFHLQYPEKCKKVLFFLQDYVLGQPDNFQIRKGAYLAVASDIKKYLE